MMYRRVALITVSAVACLSAAAVYAFTSGTDDPLTVPVPDARTAAYCRALHADLPATVDGLTRHDLKPRSELTAGWGQPAIVLRCGVPRPEKILKDPEAGGVTVNGVGWVIEPRPHGVMRLTTTLRKAYVEVTLPKKYAGDVGPLTDLADAVKRAVPGGI
jgi:Protein of unknown function (DUF3515)